VLVYGDRAREVSPRHALTEVGAHLAAGRRGEALVAGGMVAQGLADHAFADHGVDDLAPPLVTAMMLALAAAAQGASAGPARAAVSALARSDLPDLVRCRTPEGFAFYAVYPEAYAAAARTYDWGGPPLVLGLRSIGMTLGAAVAAASGGALETMRPTGHPFRRTLRLSPALRARIAAHAGPFAVVDEGPGLSGSSFGAVGDLLAELGVAEARVVYMPSHAGEPGAQADAAHRQRWRRARRLVRTLDDQLAARPMSHWFEGDVGPVLACDDISGGGWRSPDARMPADPPRERRKFRLRTADALYVARFAGLDPGGREKLGRAQALYGAGFGAGPIALRGGFLLERWVAGRTLERRDAGAVAGGLAEYLRFRQASFPVGSDAGAAADDLVDMARVNAEALCGLDIARRLDWSAAEEIGTARCHVDGRLHAWEWRATPGGFRKLDALDHSCGHDLVGAQAIAWDVAGAALELGLDDAQTAALAQACGVSAASLRVHAQAYAAFQGGLWTFAEQAAPAREARRIRLWRRRYARALARLAAR
jgi:hypothetical protein